MSTPYDSTYTPPAPALDIRLTAPGEAPRTEPFMAIVDTGADGTLIPNRYLEHAEAIDIGDATLYGVLGEAREVHLFEVDLYIGSLLLPGMVVIADDYGNEALIGRNVLNKLVLVLDGPGGVTEWFETHPAWR